VENVWDYPRPPAVEPCPRHVRVDLGGQVLAESDHALRVLETTHPPTIYVPRDDVRMDLLVPSRRSSTRCEFKGAARYLDALIGTRRYQAVGWMYPQPSPGYKALEDHIAFYPGRIDAAWLDDERVLAQDGDFYGGWITAELVGPFKGAPGTQRW
jgi:uncharacterized protein (DUF427 family)